MQENGDEWSLPGGGIDHGETSLEALARELKEELAITTDFTAKFLGIDTYFYEPKDAWLMWIMYELQFDGEYSYHSTEEVSAVRFLQPDYFKASEVPYQKLIHKWSKKSPQ